MITFDQDLVPGGRRISAWFLIASGVLVGFAAAIMGVGGGFLTFPIFVYILGVSSMTTVGTDIFQIVFTAGYAAISQYAIYGFIFYTLAMGMLIGSLLGIQIGALVTKVVKGITIRGFYAMAVLAGFVNRIFALPGKLADLEIISLSPRGRSRPRVDRRLGLLPRHRRLRGLGHLDLRQEHRNAAWGGGRAMRDNRRTKLVIGIVLMASFLVVLVAIFLPLFDGDNTLNALDNLYNSISKGSAYYVPKVLHQVAEHGAQPIALTLDVKTADLAERVAALLEDAGATVSVAGAHRDGAGRSVSHPASILRGRRRRLPRPRRRARGASTEWRRRWRCTPGGRRSAPWSAISPDRSCSTPPSSSTPSRPRRWSAPTTTTASRPARSPSAGGSSCSRWCSTWSTRSGTATPSSIIFEGLGLQLSH